MPELKEKLVDNHKEMISMDDIEVKESIHSSNDLESVKIAKERCLLLESEVTKLKCALILLSAKFGDLGVEKLAVEDELKVMRRKNADLQERVVSQGGVADEIIDLTDEKAESDMLANLMIEIKVLKRDMKNSEAEIEKWKYKYKELEGLLMDSGEYSLSRKLEGSREQTEMVNKKMTEATELNQAAKKVDDGENKIDMDNCLVSTFYYRDKGNEILESETPITPCNVVEGEGGIISDNKLVYGSQIRKKLFREAGSPNKKMGPCGPCTAGERPASVCTIDIDDSDHESETKLSKSENVMRMKSKRVVSEQSDEEDIDGSKGSLLISAKKRKRACNIVTSDSDSDDDDNKPICKFISKPIKESDKDSNLNSVPEEIVEETITRRCLRLKKSESNDKRERSSPDPSKVNTSRNECLANDDEEDENIVENESDGEGESLNGFIVKSSEETGSIGDSEGSGDSVSGDIADESDADSKGGGDSVSGDVADEPGDVSDGSLDYCDTISKIQRKRNHNFKWKFEAEMLACFGKNPEMCMKAVCAVNRQQTADEIYFKGTIHSNQRGFSHGDAPRGTKLAEFLTNGNPEGDMVKSVEELEAHNPEWLELCRVLADRYSKQLFEIYQNKEDPFFLPP